MVYQYLVGFPGGTVITNPLANSGNPGNAGQEDPLEDEMAAHFIILTWKTPQTEESGRLQSGGPPRVRHNGAYPHAFSTLL